MKILKIIEHISLDVVIQSSDEDNYRAPHPHRHKTSEPLPITLGGFTNRRWLASLSCYRICHETCR
jgi:hypothetical protein